MSDKNSDKQYTDGQKVGWCLLGIAVIFLVCLGEDGESLWPTVLLMLTAWGMLVWPEFKESLLRWSDRRTQRFRGPDDDDEFLASLNSRNPFEPPDGVS